MVRLFRAPAEAVFDAWLKPEIMVRWLLTRAETNVLVRNDPRVGGGWEIVDRRDGIEYRAVGTYLEIDRPRHLAFTFQMPQFGDAVDTVTVDLRTVADGCEMRFTHQMVVPHEEGWTPADVRAAISENENNIQCGWERMFDLLREIAEGR